MCTNLFTKMTLDAGEKSKYIAKFGGVTATDVTDGVDMSDSQTLSITGTTHTTDEAGCKVIVTKKLRHQLKEDAFRAAGIVIGNAMGKKIDQDGLALFSGFSNGLGSGSTTFTLGYLAAGVAQLKGQSEPTPPPYVFVSHPYTLNTVVDAISQPSTSNMPPELQKEMLVNYWLGNSKLYNCPIFADGNIVAATSTYGYGALFSQMALIYLVGWEPENWLEEDKSLRGWEIGIVADYGMVEEDDAYGRYMYFDMTAPSS